MDRLRRKIDQYLIDWKNSNNKRCKANWKNKCY